MNLLSNAVKFTQDGQITVTAHVGEHKKYPKRSAHQYEHDLNAEEGGVTPSKFEEKQALYISVKDTGVGIPLEEQSKLF